MKKKNIYVLCAHSDDQIFGPGGTIAKLSEDGHNIHTILFSYGEMSHPHMKPELVQKMRLKESVDADKCIGGNGVHVLGLPEGKFIKSWQKKHENTILKLIKKHKPDMIFTHSQDDTHGDHRQVYKIVTNLYDNNNLKCPLYTFDIWNLFSFKPHDQPLYVVDVSNTFQKKMKALLCFKSQINPLSYTVGNNILYLATIFRAFIRGVKYDCKWAETFRVER